MTVGIWQENSPALPQPPAMALAMPTTLGENNMLAQNWHVTKPASAIPISNLEAMYPAALWTTEIPKTKLDVSISKNP